MLEFLRELLDRRVRVKAFVSEQDFYDGVIICVDQTGLVLDASNFTVVLPLTSIYVLEVEKTDLIRMTCS